MKRLLVIKQLRRIMCGKYANKSISKLLLNPQKTQIHKHNNSKLQAMEAADDDDGKKKSFHELRAEVDPETFALWDQ